MTFEPRAGRRDGAITLSALRCFAAVVEGGSLSRAAEILGLSQPTVSVTLAGLERACGTLLLHRRPRMALTEAGSELLARTRLVLGRMDELEESVRQSGSLRRGSITVGFSTPSHAMPRIAQFMAAHPALRIRTRLGNTDGLLEALAACEVEVAVMTLIAPIETMSCTLLTTQRLVACVPASAPGRGISLEALAAGRWCCASPVR